MRRAVYRWVDTIGFLRLGEPLPLILRAAISRRSTSRSTSPTDAAFLSKEARGQPSENRFSAGHRDGRTRYVARKRIGQYDVCRRKLGWLAGHFIGTCLPNFATASCGMVEGMSG
jgi:hypothetical protein